MEIVRRHDPAAVERILRGLPQWFGVESAIAAYVEDASRLTSYWDGPTLVSVKAL